MTKTNQSPHATQNAIPAGKSIQPLEESPHPKPSKSPDSSSHWRNRPDQNLLSDPKHPVNGGITLLTDPFARRVFEDIYSELNRQHQAETPPPRQEEPAPEQPKAKPAPDKRNVKLHQSNLAWGTPKWNKDHSKGVTGMVKSWLRRQIDEEQSLTLPSANLAPGKRIRLQIRQALSGELKTVEITLPPDFAVGKPIRLRGLGKRVGPWQGDLYLIITNE